MTNRPAEWSTALARVIAFVNDKGGVGKTSNVANLGGQLAAAGYHVLAVDLNRQANLSDDFGIRDTESDDQGSGLLAALQDGTPLKPVTVRPDLDLAPGGTRLHRLTSFVVSEMSHRGMAVYNVLAAALAPVAPEYDIVLVDCPPENVIATDLALAAARWVVMPTRSDHGGLTGMKLTAERFAVARQSNPELGLLGVVLFGTLKGATAIHTEVQKDVAEAFGGQSPMFEAVIRHSERVARDCRRVGKLAHELEVEAAQQPEWWKALREGAKGPRLSSTTASVSADYRALAAELLQVLAAAEKGGQS